MIPVGPSSIQGHDVPVNKKSGGCSYRLIKMH